MRVLIVRVGAMGDVLHALPAVAALRRAMPDAHLGWAIAPRWEPLLRDSAGTAPVVNAVHRVETALWKERPFSAATARSLLALRSSLQAERYDLAIDLQGSMRSAAVGRLAGTRRFAGADVPREAPARWLYRQRVAVTAAHVIPQATEIVVAATGMALTAGETPLPQDPAAETWWAGTAWSQETRPLVLLVPQAGWGAKRWPADRLGEVARALHDAGCRVLVNASGAGDARAEAVMTAAQGKAEPAVANLPQLIALTRRMALVIAGDTGPLHLAAALGRPVVGLYGPTDAARTGPFAAGPFGATARVLRHSSSVTDHRRHAATEEGLLQITTDEVLAAAFALLDDTARGTGA